MKDSQEEPTQDEEVSNFYELLVKLASKLDYMRLKLKTLDSEPAVNKEEIIQTFKTIIDESSDIIYNKLIANLYDDSRLKELIISLIKSQFKELSS